ncbi:ACT domain-containing protein [Nocardioides sp. ChNu-153]|uniref:glycine cleavage system protein R n=1 Tax=unclassified Nocardioides TaxID=2615069 RepID=UPI002404D46F|nr:MULTISPECIES: ACT domain-containing protein [unclassified Nocardioides]MDF9717703.1 ACT domain-containing protein [Nocardioides sp. ChNu-99]MDN7121446.1 ACT domain-containing protein [Nocardioides sp. ChNu-153]
MTQHAITVLGHDRPGIIAQTTALLADLGLNIEDTSMTLLRGHFAMTLVCAGGATESRIAGALEELSADGTLTVTVREVPAEQAGAAAGAPYVLTVHGGDRPGIVSTVVGVVAEVGGNVTDLTTRLSGDLYVLLAEVDLPTTVDVDALRAALDSAAGALGVGVTLRAAEADEL